MERRQLGSTKNTNFGKWKRDECFPMVSDTLSSMVHEKIDFKYF